VVAALAEGASASEVPPDGRIVGYSGPRTGIRPLPLSSEPNERLPDVLSGSELLYGEYPGSSERCSGSRKAPLGRSCTPDSYGVVLAFWPGPEYQLGVSGSSA
jgi:hypothetical protein